MGASNVPRAWQRMTYYIGFRFGWVRVGRHAVGWSDPKLYPTMSGRRWRAWKWWVK